MKDNSFGGPVSLSLMSLKAQVDTLLEEAGGELAVKLLDRLSNLTPQQQALALQVMDKILDRISNLSHLSEKLENANSNFEDDLYNDLLSDLQLADSPVPVVSKSKLNLEVLNGGKSTEQAHNVSSRSNVVQLTPRSGLKTNKKANWLN